MEDIYKEVLSISIAILVNMQIHLNRKIHATTAWIMV